MRTLRIGILIVLLAACTVPAGDGSPSPSGPSSSPVPPDEPTVLPSTVPTAAGSVPESVMVTFRLTLTGPMPDDAAFALESGLVDGAGGAIYLCSYYGGWPICESGEAYEEALSFAPGTRLRYRFWRELDVDGASEEIEAGELTVGVTDTVVAVSYEVRP